MVKHIDWESQIGRKLRLRDLYAFITVARFGSMAKGAEKLGVSRQTVNAIETEKYDPSLPLAFKIAKLFRRSVEEIFKA